MCNKLTFLDSIAIFARMRGSVIKRLLITFTPSSNNPLFEKDDKERSPPSL